jgi:hypothetical protein
MPLKFTGRESQLQDIENLVKARQGAVFVFTTYGSQKKYNLSQRLQ